MWWYRILFISCVALDKPLNLSESQLLCLQNGKKKKEVFKDYMTYKVGNCLAYSRSAVSVCRKEHDAHDKGTSITVGSRPEEVKDSSIDSKEPKGSTDRAQPGRDP